ncbi:tetratricopeptide repeat protein [Arenibacterium sp. CAU 1754]
MRFLMILALLLPGYALAAGSGTDSSPPKTTKTTKTCKGIKVWDDKSGKCVNPQETLLDGDVLYLAARELAYAGRYGDAQGVLLAIPDQMDDRVLTYWGFTHRKMGHSDLARAYYRKALMRNPDNILARSYMGQGLIEDGKVDAAIVQWREIRARGGEGTWPEASLRDALRTGLIYDY